MRYGVSMPNTSATLRSSSAWRLPPMRTGRAPLTEEVTGIDLVREMIRVADSATLGYDDPLDRDRVRQPDRAVRGRCAGAGPRRPRDRGRRGGRQALRGVGAWRLSVSRWPRATRWSSSRR